MINSTFFDALSSDESGGDDKIAPYQHYDLNSSIVPRVLLSARMGHTEREWLACSLVRTLCNFGYYNQNRSRGHQDSNYDDISDDEIRGWMLLDAHANVARHGNMRASMRLTHDGNYCDLEQMSFFHRLYEKDTLRWQSERVLPSALVVKPSYNHRGWH
jgi:hypothetical protein